MNNKIILTAKLSASVFSANFLENKCYVVKENNNKKYQIKNGDLDEIKRWHKLFGHLNLPDLFKLKD